MINPRSVHPRMTNISDRSCRENQHTKPSPPLPPESHVIYETTWKNVIEADRIQMTIRRMRIACWVTKAIDTFSEFLRVSTATVLT